MRCITLRKSDMIVPLITEEMGLTQDDDPSSWLIIYSGVERLDADLNMTTCRNCLPPECTLQPGTRMSRQLVVLGRLHSSRCISFSFTISGQQTFVFLKSPASFLLLALSS